MSRNARARFALPLLRGLLAVAVITGVSVIGFAGPSAAKANRELQGSFSGEQTLRFSDPRCPAPGLVNFTNVSDFTFDVTRGPDWRYTADACSFITPEVPGDEPNSPPKVRAQVTTAGPFTIVAPGGTLTGSFSITRAVDLPAAGLLELEQELNITGGTGRFKHAGGECVLTGFITTPLVFAGGIRSHYAGSFTCDVSRTRRG